MAQMHHTLAYMPARELRASTCREFEANGVQIRPAMKEMLRKAEADLQQKRQAALQEKAAQAKVKICVHYATFTPLSCSYRSLHCASCLADSASASAAVSHPITPACVCRIPATSEGAPLQASAQSADEQREEASSEQEPVTKTE